MDNFSTKLPDRIFRWLRDRGLSEEVIRKRNIGWDEQGKRIVIPIYDSLGIFLFNKYRRDPESDVGPKYTYDAGSKSALYGIDQVTGFGSPQPAVIICEGEFDKLVLESNGFLAVTSTGGAGTFKEEWAQYFAGKETYMIFDYDKAGFEGRMRVAKVVPHAKSIPIPPEVGEHGDVTDYFIKLKKTADDFRILMSVAAPLPVEKEKPEEPIKKKRRRPGDGSDLEEAKKVPLDNFLKFNSSGYAKCPFHAERTGSLKKYPDGKWWCYGCGIGGDVVDLVGKMYKLTLPQTIKKILEDN